jgi:hypothetical protein
MSKRYTVMSIPVDTQESTIWWVFDRLAMRGVMRCEGFDECRECVKLANLAG